MSETVSLTFPDGSVRTYPAGTTGRDVAEAISKSLAKKALAIALNGALRDLSDPVETGAIEIVTRQDPRALERLTLQHQGLLQAIVAGDADQAQRVMDEHLDYVHQKLVQSEADVARRLRQGRFSASAGTRP